MNFTFAEAEKGLENLDRVPNEFRGMFAQDSEGKYVVQESFRSVGASIDGLNKALYAARQDAKNAKGQAIDLSPLRDYGESPADIAKGFEAKLAEAVAGAKADQKGALDKFRGDIERKHAAELAAERQMMNTYRSQLHQTLVQNELLGAIAQEKGTQALLLPAMSGMVRVIEEDAKDAKGNPIKRARVIVVDSDGEERMSTTTGAGMSVLELARELKAKPEYAAAFASDVSGGGGMRKQTIGGDSRPKQGEKTAQEKIAAGMRKRFG